MRNEQNGTVCIIPQSLDPVHSYLFPFYRFIHDPDCEAVTRHVKVSVATALVPEFSSLVRLHPKLMFAYQVTMSMDGCTLPKCELFGLFSCFFNFLKNTN